MVQRKVNYNKIFMPLVGLSYIIAIIYSALILEINFKAVIGNLTHISIVLIPVTIISALFDKYLWKLKLFKPLTERLGIPPDLNGRWEGKYIREYPKNMVLEENFVVEIEQSLSKFNIHQYYKDNRDCDSITVSIAVDGDVNYVCYYWDGAAPNANETEKFLGFTKLKIIHPAKMFYKKNEMELRGEYFTNRLTPTKGTVELNWKSNNLHRKY